MRETKDTPSKHSRRSGECSFHARHGATAILCAVAMLLSVTGCSSGQVVSDFQKRDKTVVINYDKCRTQDESEDGSSSSSSSSSSTPVKKDADGTGFTIEIPEEYQGIQQNYGYGSGLECLIDGVTTSMGWVQWGVEGNGGAAGEIARRWDREGRPYVADALPAVEGRVLITTKEIYGNPGDYVDVTYADGHVLHAMIFDHQGSNDDAAGIQPFSKYGHAVTSNTCNVLEWYSDCSEDKHLWRSGQNPCSITGFEWVTGTVVSIYNTNGVYTGAAEDSSGARTDPTTEECNSKYEDDNNVQVNPGEAAAVDPSTSARLQWLYGDSGVPTSDADNKKWLESFDVVVRLPSGEKGTWNLTMHKKLKTEVQAMFQDIYNNTDYKINPSDGNSLRDWNNEAGNFAGAQSNSNHAYGLAIDINVGSNNGTGSCDVGTSYNPGSDPLSLTADSKVIKIIKDHGFFWGGDWTDPKDYMHIAYTDH